MLTDRSKIIRKPAITFVCRDNLHITVIKFMQQSKWIINLFLTTNKTLSMYSFCCLCILFVVYVFFLLSMYYFCSSMYSYCCLCILIVVYVFFLLSMYSFCSSMYSYCCLCILFLSMYSFCSSMYS